MVKVSEDTVCSVKLGRMLGLCKKAGRLDAGSERVLESVKKGKACLVLYASDISANTLKKFNDSCTYYKKKIAACPLTMAQLSAFLGMTGNTAAASINDNGFAAAILKILNSENSSSVDSAEKEFGRQMQ